MSVLNRSRSCVAYAGVGVYNNLLVSLCSESVIFANQQCMWSATAGMPPPLSSTMTPSLLVSFKPCTQTGVGHIIMQSPMKSCALDPLLLFLVANLLIYCCPIWRPWSMSRWCKVGSQLLRNMPSFHRLKKSGFDPNFTPMSNLSFISKVMEWSAVRRLNDYFATIEPLPGHQSAYSKKHLSETAMLCVRSDVLTSEK